MMELPKFEIQLPTSLHAKRRGIVYAWPKPKKLDIRRATKPMIHQALSGTVLVSQVGYSTRYCFIKFSEETVAILGSKMPRGIGPSSPAYLRVQEHHNRFDVYCCYLDNTRRVALWATQELPEWVWRLRYADS